jgi:hypothetical protein
MSKNYYSILNLSEGASLDEIKRAYRHLALQYHPDINPSPEAHELFIEISHAYEYLLEKSMQENNPEQTYEYNFDDEWAEILKEIKNESRVRAQKQREMRKEAERKRNEEFQKSGLYDLSLIVRYLIHYLSVLLGFGLIVFPVYISVTQDKRAFFYLFYFWMVGLFLLIYIYSQRRTWFNLGSFYFKWKDILKLINYQNNNSIENCYYCKNLKANSFPYKHSMLVVRDIQLRNRGPLQHDARYKRDYVDIAVPRSRKAFFIHVSTSLIKVFCVLLSFVFLPIESLVWKFLIGALCGGIIATLLLLISGTRSCTTHLLNPTLLIKLIVWILVLISLTDFRSKFNITTSEYTLAAFTITAFFIDFVVDPIASFIFRKQVWKPLFKQPSQISHFFDQGYQNNLEIPVWSTLYPLFRWLF